MLTLAPSMAVHDFRFVCFNVDEPSYDIPEAETLDLSRDCNSLPSWLSSSWLVPGASFSYCLPHSPHSEGFLYLGGNTIVREDKLTVHAPLVWNNDPELMSMYFIDLIGISLDDEDLPILAGTFGGNASANLAMETTFTMLAPDVYTPLRDSF